MEYLKLALEYITGKRGLSDYAFLGGDLSSTAISFRDVSRPFHFNEVILDKNLDKLKEGFLLVSEKDLIRHNGSFYEGVNKIYSKNEMKKLLKMSEVVLVR
jgi:hypothetical protein